MTPQSYCEQKLRQSGSNFYFSFLFLTPNQRQAMIALYAFCREVDDIVDQVNEKGHDINIAKSKLEWWKTEINNIYTKHASHPIAQAITESLINYNLKQEFFIDIINGMEMDLCHNGFETIEELKNYCYHAAGAVGLLSIEITGYNKENKKKIQDYAKNLGISLQLINILRDVKEDYQRGRVYIPRQVMSEFSVPIDTLSNTDSTEINNLHARALFSYLADQAEFYYQQAMNNLTDEDRYPQKSGLIMANIYLAILKKIKQQQYPVLQQRISIHPLHKLWIAWITARKESKREKQRRQ